MKLFWGKQPRMNEQSPVGSGNKSWYVHQFQLQLNNCKLRKHGNLYNNIIDMQFVCQGKR